MKLRLLISTLCVASIAMAGCASKVTQPDEYSGFLSDYSQLKEAKSPSGAEVMRWVDPKLDLSRYTAVYIEPTQFYPKPQATAKIPDSTLTGINAYYSQALRRELEKSLPLANGPGPGVMVVRAAITAVSSKTEGLKPYEFIPVALVAAAVSTGTGIRDQETTLGTEAQFLDGSSGKVLAQVVRKGTGKPLANDSQVMKADDVKGVIDGWASDLHQSYLKLKRL
ncbi:MULTISPECIES: DUF3313 domain-containing protein [Pseudomonas fluorescens group]|uniref:DUF3313 domain-containing protein n=2 Tax=Pseudomonas fluorescens group TaxID=136843 RepID=A0A9X5L184_PSEMA|nr:MULTISPECIES: DUF3313 domain-containing protein [Pseudomonas fluorescens group]MCD7040868.1 DUF3313 domain-containing protein [Pseudomonas petroselini]MCD7048224.1 DUF3313 domain-containing protein [Pseudomonas petroselini]MCD7070731.1 DUF3313 domain-containing protein [Pseudomonas petroselini]MCD7080689.1 DUF3313 domain-containing protein [Pseudomonas petroselini]MCM2379779.1 DUF3313 domain-containing protein [Pseudomonas marginalis]